jgi:leader peptidase (prepilin peptidase)/N-methyltransferase
VLFAFAAWHFGYTAAGLGAMLFSRRMVALTGIDFDTQLLPDDITLPAAMGRPAVQRLGGVFTDLKSAVIGAMAGYLSLWAVYWGFKLATGKEGMGYGDFKLLAAIGAWLGWQMLPLTILPPPSSARWSASPCIVFAGRGATCPSPSAPTSPPPESSPCSGANP